MNQINEKVFDCVHMCVNVLSEFSATTNFSHHSSTKKTYFSYPLNLLSLSPIEKAKTKLRVK